MNYVIYISYTCSSQNRPLSEESQLKTLPLRFKLRIFKLLIYDSDKINYFNKRKIKLYSPFSQLQHSTK